MDNYLKSNRAVKIIIYGKHCNDDLTEKSIINYLNWGFRTFIFMVEECLNGLLLQDIYGADEFPTSSKQTDHLKYKPQQKLNMLLLT